MNRNGSTIVLNSHVLSEIAMICNRVAILKRGRVIVQDDIKHLRNLDLETYTVEFAETESLPAYVDVKIRTGDTIKAEIPTGHLSDFIRFTQESGLKLYDCSLKKVSLEDAFLNIVKGEE